MNHDPRGLSASFLEVGASSFVDFAARVAPEILPRSAPADGDVPHATTIVAAAFASGVVVAGDRRATWGNLIAQRDIEKVFGADEFSIIGVAGAAGVAVELVRLFQVELEHYEKIEGAPLSLDGKANRLAGMIRGNLSLAMQGLAAIPLFAGWDAERECGRIFSYDVTGGRYEETDFYAVGSGAAFARGSMKKLHRPGHDERGAVVVAVQALIDSADDDAATAGPDLLRRIYPVVLSVTAAGIRRLGQDEIEAVVTEVIAARRGRPDGPGAPLL